MGILADLQHAVGAVEDAGRTPTVIEVGGRQAEALRAWFAAVPDRFKRPARGAPPRPPEFAVFLGIPVREVEAPDYLEVVADA